MKRSHLQLTVAQNVVNVKFVIGIFVLLGKRLTVPVEKKWLTDKTDYLFT